LYRRYGIGIDEFITKAKNSMPFNMVLMTSITTYWYPGVQKAVELVKDIVGDVPVILGGIYATLYHEHAADKSGVDFICKGCLASGFHFALYTFGFKLRQKREPTPSYALSFYKKTTFALLLTSTGCPFSCSYCASKLLRGTYQRRSPDDVLKEIRELYGMGANDYAFYDDALLVDADNHIKPILRGVIEAGLDVRFHTPNGLHARLMDDELARLMKAAHFRTIRLGLETADDERQRTTGGKVSTDDLERAVLHLKRQGFTKKDIGVYLMYGLPGQDLNEVKEGIRFSKGLDVHINLAEFSPIRGTRSWSELLQRGIINDNLDLLLTNNTVFSYLYSSYDARDIAKLKLDVKAYNAE
jgi:radical SAM superfamily enzyme YgiQ (UPF0313 family)